MPRSNKTKAQSGNLSIHTESHQIDAPIIPISIIEALSKENSLDWYKNEITKEADNRRNVNNLEKKRNYRLLLLIIIGSFTVVCFIGFLFFKLYLGNIVISPYFLSGLPIFIISFAFLIKNIKN